MEVGAYLVVDAQLFELVEPGEGRLDDPPGFAQSRAVRGAAAGDLGGDPACADETPVRGCSVAQGLWANERHGS